MQCLLKRPQSVLTGPRLLERRGSLVLHALRASASSTARQTSSKDGEVVVVVGAGAAGLTAAYFAAQAGARVIVLERTREAGKKILMSGGSRCNVLPMHIDLQRDFFTESSRTSLKAVFASWSLSRCRQWLEEDVGLELGEEAETSKVFPLSNSSREVRNKLLDACRSQGVEVRFNSSLEGLRYLDAQSNTASDSPTRSHSSTSSASDSSPQAIVSDSSTSCSSSSSSSSSSSGSSFSEKNRRNLDRVNQRSSDSGEEAGLSWSAQKGSSLSSNGTYIEGHGRDGGGGFRWLCRLGGEGGELEASKLIICTGGMSFPAVGTDGTGHRILEGLGHELNPPYPALTPLVGAHPADHQLAGLSMYEVEMWAEPSTSHGTPPAALQEPAAKKQGRLKSQRNALLFTHKGYSGPAVLDLSHVAIMALLRNEEPPRLRVNWTGHTAAAWEERLKVGGTAFVSTVLQRFGVRERLAAAIVEELQLQGRKMSQLSRSERAALISMLTGYELKWSSHEGYKKAEVTGGGVPLSQVNCATMESKVLPGVYLAGEVCDVFGRIGGFNFYWAWVSGRLAGLGAGKPRKEKKKAS